MNAAGDPDGGRGTDEGVTFIEVLIAVVLLGFAAIGILPVFSEQIRGSVLQRDFADARRYIVSAGDYAVSQDFVKDVLQPCNQTAPPYADGYEAEIVGAAASHRPDGWADLKVTAVKWFNGSNFTGADPVGDDEEDPCPDVYVQFTLQQISLEVVSPSGRVVETLDVVTGMLPHEGGA